MSLTIHITFHYLQKTFHQILPQQYQNSIIIIIILMTSLRLTTQSQHLQLKKQLIISQKKQSELNTYILQLQQKLSHQTTILSNLQRLKQNEHQIRDVLRLKVSEIEDEKQQLSNELRITQELLKESEKQSNQFQGMYEMEVIRNKGDMKRLESSRTSNGGGNRVVMDQSYRITELTKQIQIMKQLHQEEVKKIQGEYQKTISKVQGEKIQLEKIMRLRENERAIINPPSYRQRKVSEDAYNKEMQKLFGIKCEEYEEELNQKDEEISEMEEEIKMMKLKEMQMEEKYMEMTSIVRQTIQELQTVKGQKDILQKTLDFSKKISEEQRLQFNKILQIQKQNHLIQIQQLKQNLSTDLNKWSQSNSIERVGETKKLCNFILTKLKVIHVFTSDLKKYFQNQQIEMKQMLGEIAEKLLGWIDNVNRKSDEKERKQKRKDTNSEYQALIEKYKIVLREKDQQILELRKSKFKYSQNIQYLNKILVDD